MTAPSPTRTLDTDLALFWRVMRDVSCEIATRNAIPVELFGFEPETPEELALSRKRRHHGRELPRRSEMHRRYATRRKARRTRRGR